VAGDSRLEFNDAVRECLASCYLTDLPVAALAEYVEVLKRRDWTASEIHKVEAAVLKILLAVVSKDERDDLVNRMIKPRGDRPATAQPAAESGGSKKSGKSRAPNRESASRESSERSSDQARPRVTRTNGNVLPAPDGLGAGDSTARRA
jgi:hypothetical protein